MNVANSTNAADELLTEAAAANLLSISMRTLQAWRVKGAGPSFVKIGRAVRYRRNDLLAWIEINTVASTSAVPGASR